jgi:hypothetical protein
VASNWLAFILLVVQWIFILGRGKAGDGRGCGRLGLTSRSSARPSEASIE